MAKSDLEELAKKLRAESEANDRLRAGMQSRALPLRQEMRKAIPFLESRKGVAAANLTDLAVRLGELWETDELTQSYHFMAQAAARGWDLPEETDDPEAALESYLELVEADRSESWASPYTLPLADLLGLEAGMKLGPETVPSDVRSRAHLAEALVLRAIEALDDEPGSDRFRRGLPSWLRAAIIEDRLYRLAGYRTELEGRVRFVSPERASAFVLRHHSALRDVNPRGALYDLGLEIGGRLVAVATVTTPSGQLPIEESAHIVEVSRVASDASVHGAASALVAKVIGLVDASRRYGTTRPGLLITYSFLSELGTTYKSLEMLGLRPVEFTAARTSQSPGSSRSRVAAAADVPKIRWEAGARAAPADKTLLRLVRPYVKASEGRALDKEDLKPLNVDRLKDLIQALTNRRPRLTDRGKLVAMLLGWKK